MDIEEFYSADERRRRSAEVELGTDWHDAQGNRYELSWVEDTGELYVMLERAPEADTWTPFGDIEVEKVPVDQLIVRVVGRVATRQELDRLLEGWEQAMASPDSVSWVAERLRQNGAAVT